MNTPRNEHEAHGALVDTHEARMLRAAERARAEALRQARQRERMAWRVTPWIDRAIVTFCVLSWLALLVKVS